MSDKKSRNKRLQAGDDLIWGVHTVTETLERAPRTLTEIIVAKGRGGAKLQAVIDLARVAGVRVRFVDGLEIDGPGRINHQGLAARVQPAETLDEGALLERIRDIDVPPFVLALDCIQDPHNLGAILRSAAAAGVHGVVLTRDRSAPLSGTVAKIAAGALAHLDVCTVTNLATFLGQLKEAGLWIYGTVKDDGQSIHDTDLGGGVCLVIGNEEKGLRPLVRKSCDFAVTIPMPGALDSLNASVAAGIALFEVVRQRRD
ncbi:23S rRNA (guanosine(2251)-2'-O)-methyltransferase RlmB [bacterium]|nr:23S rRNA (guanosine(2251)-2'-O)-methyltransferase RlmB [bacterium]